MRNNKPTSLEAVAFDSADPGETQTQSTEQMDPLTLIRDELHWELMELFENKWAMYGPYGDE